MRKAILYSHKMTYDIVTDDAWTPIYTGYIEEGKDLSDISRSFEKGYIDFQDPIKASLENKDIKGPLISGLKNMISTVYSYADAADSAFSSMSTTTARNTQKYMAIDKSSGAESFAMGKHDFTIYKILALNGPTGKFEMPEGVSDASKITSTNLSATLTAFSELACGNVSSDAKTNTVITTNPGPNTLQWTNGMLLSLSDSKTREHITKTIQGAVTAFQPTLTPYDWGAEGQIRGWIADKLYEIGLGNRTWGTEQQISHINAFYASIFDVEHDMAEKTLEAFPGTMYRLKVIGANDTAIFDVGPFIPSTIGLVVDFSNIDNNGFPLKSGITIGKIIPLTTTSTTAKS